MEYRRTTHHIYLNNYHLVWCPKRRKAILINHVKTCLRDIMERLAKEKHWTIIALEIMPDHVHLFVSVPPTVSPHMAANSFKGRSSNVLRKEFPELLKLPSLWTHSYFSSTAGNVSTETIRRYILEQSKI